MRKTGKMMAAFLTALITPALAYTAVCAPFSVYAAAQEPLEVSGEADSPESGGDAASAADATPTDGDFVSGEPFAALAVTPLAITKHPDNLHIEPDPDTPANFSVEADGDGIAYQWQASSPNYCDANWSDDVDDDVIWEDILDGSYGVSGFKDSNLSISADYTANWDDTGFRCVVTDSRGAKVKSDAAILDVSGGYYPEITSVLGIPIGPYYTMSRAGKPEYAIELNVTVCNKVSTILVDDIVWEFGTLKDPPDDVLLSPPPPPEGSPTYEQTLNPGQNDVYVSLKYDESYICYHISITRKSASGGSSEPDNGGSSEPDGNIPGNSPDDDPGSGTSSGTDHGDDGDSGNDAQDAGNKPTGIRPTASTPPSPPREEAVITNANANPSTGGGDIPDAPETGDKSNAVLWIIMLISPVLASSGLIAVYMGRRGGKG